MIKQFIFLTAILIFIVSCAPTVDNVNPESEVSPVNDEDVPMNTAVPSDTPLDNAPNTIPDPTAEPEVEEIKPEDVLPSERPIIDVSEMTPEPVEAGESEETTPPKLDPDDPAAQLVQDVMIDLGSKLGIDISEVTLVSIEETVWRDSSLGCPQPGMNYLQVLTDGYNITLSANGETFSYHSKGTSAFIYCNTKPSAGLPIRQPIAPEQ